MAPSSPSPTVNMPATPPALNASRIALRRPDSLAAFAVRTFARTASHMPVYPVIALNPAPRMNATERPTRMNVSPWAAFSETGSAKNSTTVSRPMKTPTVRNWRLR